MSLPKTPVLLGVLVLSVAAAAPAQTAEKGSAKRIELTTSEAGKAAIAAALVEVMNWGGGTRITPKLDATVEVDPQFGLGRAVYAGFSTKFNNAAEDRNRELDRAVREAASASTAELLMATAIREWRASRPAAARDIVDVVKQLAPDDPFPAWFRSIIVPANAQDSKEVAEAAIKRMPDAGALYNNLAYRLQALGRPDDAIATVRKYVELVPDHPNSHDSHAEILQFQGKHDAAIAAYTTALKLDPAFEVAHEGIAEVEANRGNPSAARLHLTASLELAATPARKAQLHREVAHMYLWEGKTREAKQHYAQALDLVTQANVPNAGAGDHRFIGMIDVLTGKKADGIKHMAAGHAISSTPVWAVNDGLFAYFVGDSRAFENAMQTARESAAAQPDNQAFRQNVSLLEQMDALRGNDLTAAKAARASMVTTVYKMYAAALMVGPLMKAGDKEDAAAAKREVLAYTSLDGNAAIARLMLRQR